MAGWGMLPFTGRPYTGGADGMKAGQDGVGNYVQWQSGLPTVPDPQLEALYRAAIPGYGNTRAGVPIRMPAEMYPRPATPQPAPTAPTVRAPATPVLSNAPRTQFWPAGMPAPSFGTGTGSVQGRPVGGSSVKLAGPSPTATAANPGGLPQPGSPTGRWMPRPSVGPAPITPQTPQKAGPIVVNPMLARQARQVPQMPAFLRR